MPKLGINIDHIATLRQARREFDPDPVVAAHISEQAGADSIVCHLREDRRHIQDEDLRQLKKEVRTRLNLEMALSEEIIAIALKVKPDQCTLVPERRQEVTTEGGLDVIRHFRRVKDATARLTAKRIDVSLFIAPDQRQIESSKKAGVTMIELHTGCYANARSKSTQQRELKRLVTMTKFAQELGLVVNAGHGLNYTNTIPVATIPGMEELNIGFSIVSRAVFVGLSQAVTEMKALIAS